MKRLRNPIPFLDGPRNRLQLILLILTIAIGLQFYFFVEQAGNSGPITIQRPSGVEGFLPIGALLGWKQLFSKGSWDPIHPAAMVILLYAAMISLFFRKAFCSWFCPIGTISEWLWKAGHRLLGKNVKIPNALDWPMRSFKYLLLSFFIFITLKMSESQIESFLNGPYYKLADVKMLHFFTQISTTTLITILALVILSVPIRNFWCRYLCPYGALMGIISFFSPTAIRRQEENCTNCLKCSRACPSNLPVHAKKNIASPECSGCMDCVNICPSAETLALRTSGSGLPGWNAGQLAVAVFVLFVVSVYIAQLTGHWKSVVGEGEFRMLLRMIDSPALIHPRF